MPRLVHRHDFVIVGQGLAGTALAWALRHRGFDVAFVDRGDRVTSSRIAAGLMTPVTGQRLVANWRYREFFTTAKGFYERIETVTGTRFFHHQAAIRLLLGEAEHATFERRAKAQLSDFTAPMGHLPSEWFAPQPYGGFAMPDAARLDTSAYLQASYTFFHQRHAHYLLDLDVTRDVVLESNTIRIPRLACVADRLIFCQGFDGVRNPFFSELPFSAVKGEVLTLQIPGLTEERVLHRGVWLAPLGDERFLAGSTYDRTELDQIPTLKGREEICSRLREFLQLPFTVLDHRAAVRPSLLHGRPVMGFHPEHARIGCFNGFGSKGALLAPFLAQHFCEVMLGNTALSSEFALPISSRSTRSRPPL